MRVKALAEMRRIVEIRMRLAEPRVKRLEEVAAYKGLTVDQYVSEVIDAALADERAKVREESVFASTALMAVEHLYT